MSQRRRSQRLTAQPAEEQQLLAQRTPARPDERDGARPDGRESWTLLLADMEQGTGTGNWNTELGTLIELGTVAGPVEGGDRTGHLYLRRLAAVVCGVGVTTKRLDAERHKQAVLVGAHV